MSNVPLQFAICNAHVGLPVSKFNTREITPRAMCRWCSVLTTVPTSVLTTALGNEERLTATKAGESDLISTDTSKAGDVTLSQVHPDTPRVNAFLPLSSRRSCSSQTVPHKRPPTWKRHLRTNPDVLLAPVRRSKRERAGRHLADMLHVSHDRILP